MSLKLFNPGVCGALALALVPVLHASADRFDSEIRPILKEYCLACHSTEKQKGDLDLERFTSIAAVRSEPKVWQQVEEQLGLGEMPPRDKPQPSSEKKELLNTWVRELLADLAKSNAGDPGPTVLRRLSNAEYTHTVRDLTGVDSLDPAREFPTDGAAGEGFSNTGAALVMSPALLSKYLEAARGIAAHAVPLPDGIRFSSHVFQRDWTDEKLTAIRSFYARFSENGGGTAVNLQGIRFDTRDGGIIPMEKYFAATLAHRDALRSGQSSVEQVAMRTGLVPKYLGILWNALTDDSPTLLMAGIRSDWNAAGITDAPRLAASVRDWQGALWRFTTVGHIGKRDGPKAWQEPVNPIAFRQEVRTRLSSTNDAEAVELFLSVTDAGDGPAGDLVFFDNPRITLPGRPELPLRDLRGRVAALSSFRERAFATTERSLAAAAELMASAEPGDVVSLAAKHGVEPLILTAWLECLGMGLGDAHVEGWITNQLKKVESHDFIQGWTAADALSVMANSSDAMVRVPGTMKPHGIAMHPAPKRRVVAGWRSPVTGSAVIQAKVKHAHPECGNGVWWAIDVRRGTVRQRLASGHAQGTREVTVGPLENVPVRTGDVVVLVIGPRDGNHSCDLTAVDMTLRVGGREWDLASDVSPDILAGNPHADRQGNPGVWHFFSEADSDNGTAPTFPDNSLLAKWMASTNAVERAGLAAELRQKLVRNRAEENRGDADDKLVRQLSSMGGPLLAAAWRAPLEPASGGDFAAQSWGVDPALFVPEATSSGRTKSLRIQAPAILEIRLPADLVQGGEFVSSVSLDPAADPNGSAQVAVLRQRPATPIGLTPGASKSTGGKSTWSDGDRPVVSDAPVLVRDGSTAQRRFLKSFDDFRAVFPAALCYTKIVPVDEVVTLTLLHREDEALQRLMLDEAQTAELNRHWDELYFVSHTALKQVDAFEQLWQFATQDADPSAFTPMGEPIRKKAAEFRETLRRAEPRHVDAVVSFAERAWRRPLTREEQKHLGDLYQKLRTEDLPHDSAWRTVLARVLVAPAFLYKMEQPVGTSHPSPVSDHELAVRLAYFLWSSGPDAALASFANQGKLGQPGVLKAEARRMMGDGRIRRMAVEFGAQWLHTRDFDRLDEKSERHFPTFAALRGAMNEEPIRFFTDFFQSNGSILSLLDADHTFVNGPLAAHYGMAGVSGEEWRRVDGVRALGRGGILGFAATLAKQSGASRTSPILRGNWLCETLLGERLPRPPKGVPVLPEEAPAGFSERQLIERHSSDPKCAVCHVRIDPYGFSLEAFDAIGRYRTNDTAGLPIQTSTRLANGTVFDGLAGLREHLLRDKRDVFVRQFVRKLLGYSLGRSIQLSDQPLLDAITARLSVEGYRIGVAVEMIVESRQFREIRGRDQQAGL